MHRVLIPGAGKIGAPIFGLLAESKSYKVDRGNFFTGFIAQEQFRRTDILANRFGRYHALGGTQDVSREVAVSSRAGHQHRQQVKAR